MELLNLVRQWGGSSTDAVLDPNTIIFKTPLVEGVIGYRLASQCAVAFGDPICNPIDWKLMANEFAQFHITSGHPIIFIGASKAFTQVAMQNICKASIEFGDELIFDPIQDPRDWPGDHGSLVRRKIRHAIKENVSVHEYTQNDQKLEKELEELAKRWLASRSGPQIHISNVHLFENRLGKRWFYAVKEKTVVGIIVLNHLKAQKGWLINHLMITPDAPHGTPENLFVSALDALRVEGCHYVTVGSVPASRLGEIVGLSITSAWLSKTTFHLAKQFYNLGGKSTFWDKFHPQRKQAFLLFGENRLRFRAILAILHALQGEIKI